MQPESASVELWTYVSAVMRRWWLVLILAAAIGAAAWWTTKAPAVYTATATLLISRSSAVPSLGDIQLNRELAIASKDIVTTRPVLERAATRLGDGVTPDSIRGLIRVDPIGTAGLLAVTTTHGDPAYAEAVAREVAEAFIDKTVEDRLANLARLQAAAAAQGVPLDSASLSSQLSSAVLLTIIEPPQARLKSSALSRNAATVLGAVLGAISGALLAILWNRLSDRVESPETIETEAGIPVLGVIGRWNSGPNGAGLVVGADHRSTHAEAYRHIATNLTFLITKSASKVVVVTSPGPGDGKTTTTLNVAAALAERADTRVLVVDGDLRRPTIHKKLGLESAPGFSTLLADGTMKLPAAVRQTAVPNLDALPAGPIPPNPASLVTSPHLDALVAEMRSTYRYVIFDSSPALVVADTAILGRIADGYVLVINTGETRIQQLRASLRSLSLTSVPVSGVVFNRFRRPRLGYGAGSSYAYNSQYYEYSDQQSANGLAKVGRRGARKTTS